MTTPLSYIASETGRIQPSGGSMTLRPVPRRRLSAALAAVVLLASGAAGCEAGQSTHAHPLTAPWSANLLVASHAPFDFYPGGWTTPDSRDAVTYSAQGGQAGSGAISLRNSSA